MGGKFSNLKEWFSTKTKVESNQESRLQKSNSPISNSCDFVLWLNMKALHKI